MGSITVKQKISTINQKYIWLAKAASVNKHTKNNRSFEISF